jgi:hypothetical protein
MMMIMNNTTSSINSCLHCLDTFTHCERSLVLLLKTHSMVVVALVQATLDTLILQIA